MAGWWHRNAGAGYRGVRALPVMVMLAVLGACATLATPDEYVNIRVRHFPMEEGPTILRVTGEPRYSALLYCGAHIEKKGRVGRVYVKLANTCDGPRAEPRIDFVFTVPGELDILYFGDSNRVLWQR